MKRTVFTIILSFVCVLINSQESKTTYNFLRVPISAHASAMGGDNVSLIEDDASLVFSNPSLLSSVEDKSLFLGYMNYMSGCNMASAAFTKILNDRASYAVSAQYSDYGKMKETSVSGEILGDFSAKDISFAGYFSYLLTDNLAGGVTAKVITSNIAGYNSVGMGVDLGLNYYNSDKNLSLSLVARNLGGQLKAYNDDFERMPFNLVFGVSKQFNKAPFRLHLTLIDLTDWSHSFAEHLNIGADVLLSDAFWLGVGYNFKRAKEMKIVTADSESSHLAGLTFGGGLQLQRFKFNVAYGKLHVSSSSLTLNASYSL